jgi:hypothetical protein
LNEFCDVTPFSETSLFDVLSNKRCLRAPADLGISYLYNYLKTLKCSTMVVEKAYVDRDFLDDFAHYYVRCFRPYDRFCKRVHFFSGVDETLLAKYFEGEADVDVLVRNLNRDYLGFVVVKPLPSAIIGRTVVKPWEGTISSGEDEPGRRSIRCLRSYDVNFAGIKLNILGLGFQEQDKVLAACATSALWSAFQRTSEMFGHGQPSLFEITTHATRYLQFTRTIPSEGLTVSQMCQAIRETGLEAELKEVCRPSKVGKGAELKYPLLAACYGYLRVGMPVVLAVLIKGRGEHAMTLVGYRIGPEGPGFDEMELWQPGSGLQLKGSRIVSLYAHDDQIGPFSKLEVLKGEPDKYPIELASSWRLATGQPTNLVPLTIILPIYHKVRVPFISTLRLASRLNALLEETLEGNELIEWDIFLSSVNEYKREISRRPGIPKKVRFEMLSLCHPRFFWRVRAFIGDEEACEMLMDATDMELSFQLYALNIFSDDVNKRLLSISPELREGLARDPLGRFLIGFVDSHVK